MADLHPGVWGIDIGQCALKALRLEEIDGQITATAFDYVEHAKILSQPDADPDQLTREALEKFLARNSLRGDLVAISVPGQSGLARFVKLPPVEEKKIPDIVRFEAKQQIPFPLDEVVWDFQKIGAGSVTDGFAMETEIGLFALKRDMVNRYLQHFKEVHVEIHVVQMAPLALCNFVAFDLLDKDTTPPSAAAEGEEETGEPKAKERHCIVALDIGTDNSNLVVTDGERIIWQRPIPFGGNHFTRALTKDLKLTFAKAEHLKRNATKSPDLKQILAALKPVLNDFAGEVQRSLGYFTNTHRNAQIEYMVGLGNAFRLPGLQKFLSEKLQLEVRKLPKLQRLAGETVIAAPAFTQNLMSFATAYGLALQGLKQTRLQTNLLPPEIQFDRMIRAKKPWAVGAAAALLLGVLFTTVHYGLAFRAVAADTVVKAMEEGAGVKSKNDQAERAFKTKDEDIKKNEDNVRNIIAGQDERMNWILLSRYINDCLPVPGHLLQGKFKSQDGKDLVVTDHAGKDHRFTKDDVMVVVQGQPIDLAKLARGMSEEISVVYPEPMPEKVKKDYWTPEARYAFYKFWERQAGGRNGDVRPDDEGAKDLMQVNIESIIPQYSTDLKQFLEKLRNDKKALSIELLGMTEKDKKEPPEGAGWVVELRGYTNHDGRALFLKDTFINKLNTLARPDAGADADKKDASDKKPAASVEKSEEKKDEKQEFWNTVVANKISHAVLYEFVPHTEKDDTKTSLLASVVSNFVVTSGAWTPLVGATQGGGRAKGGEGNGPGAGGMKPTLGGRFMNNNNKFKEGSGRIKGGTGGNSPPAENDTSKILKAAEPEKPIGPTRVDFVILFVWKEPTPSDSRRGN